MAGKVFTLPSFIREELRSILSRSAGWLKTTLCNLQRYHVLPRAAGHLGWRSAVRLIRPGSFVLMLTAISLLGVGPGLVLCGFVVSRGSVGVGNGAAPFVVGIGLVGVLVGRGLDLA